jgi:hypothetical protein
MYALASTDRDPRNHELPFQVRHPIRVPTSNSEDRVMPGDCRVRVEAMYLLHCLTVPLSQQDLNTRTAPTKSTGQWYLHEFKRRFLVDVVSICAHDHHLRRPDMPVDLSHLLLVPSDRLDGSCPSKCTA